MRNKQQQPSMVKNVMNNDNNKTISHCNNDTSTTTNDDNIIHDTDTDVKKKIISIRYMTAANALHFTSYECSRVAIMALLTSKSIGYQSASIVSLATGCVCPFSILLLYYYSYMLNKYGPAKSLYYSTLLFSFYIGCIGILVDVMLTTTIITSNTNHYKTTCRIVLFITYIITNSFVQLFFTQHWSFLTSIFRTNTREQSIETTESSTSLVASNYFPIISGIASISATIVGYIISQQYIQQLAFVSLPRMLIVSSFLMILCGYCSNQAYYYSSISQTEKDNDDFTIVKDISNTCKDEQKQSQPSISTSSSSGTGTGTGSSSSTGSITSVYQRTRILFHRVPILYILCQEVFVCQAVSSIISYIFVSTTKRILYNYDIYRATYTGNVYAIINFGSGILEFLVLPSTLKYIQNKKYSWYSMPIIIIVLAFVILITPSSSSISSTSSININDPPLIHDNNTNYLLLYIVTIAFVTMKIFEYSIRGIMTEMVYTTLDYESRYFGKEVIGLVANRFGKSLSAITVAIISIKYSTTDSSTTGSSDIENFDTKTAPQLLIVTTCIWLYISTVAANQIEASRNVVVDENKKNL